MKFKLLLVIAVVGGVYYFDIKPAEAWDKGGELWAQFSDDFKALTSGEATREISAKVSTTTQSVPSNVSGDSAGYFADRKAAAEAQANTINSTADQHVKRLEESIDQQTQ